ncbi:MAG: MFS transporter [Candidatus Omnitrophica bacterium]|nr:MFS transporter [Candidatus Omnitrophota bacterium]
MIKTDRKSLKRGFLILSWSLYDLANQFFALNVVSLYFVRWITLEKGAPEIFYSLAYGVSVLLVALCAPVLGAISDMLNRRKPFLLYLTLLSVVFTMGLGLGVNLFVGLLFFVIANFGCQAAVVFYNALMINVAPREKIGIVSGFGRMVGYSGALLAMYLIKPVVIRSGYQATFLPTGILFLIFSLPCLIFVKDKGQKRKIDLKGFIKKERIFEVFRRLKGIGFDSRLYPGLPEFLRASFFCMAVVNVIILFMSVYATKAFGLDEGRIISLISFSTLFAIIGSISSGYISDRVGAKASLLAIFILWSVSLFLGALLRDPRIYWLVGALVGTALGATWVVMRALAVSLTPPEKIGEIFGLFNLVGYLSGICGALFWGLLLLFLSPWGENGYRIALGSLNLFLFIGFIFILRIPNQKAEKNIHP